MGWKERKQVAQDLKSVYRAATEEEARREMAAFTERWNPKYPTIAALWQRNWERVIPFFAFPAEIRKVIYTTNAVESLNMSQRKALKTRAAFPSEEAALKVMMSVPTLPTTVLSEMTSCQPIVFRSVLEFLGSSLLRVLRPGMGSRLHAKAH